MRAPSWPTSPAWKPSSPSSACSLLCSTTRSTHNKSKVCFLLPGHGSVPRNFPFYLTVGLLPQEILPRLWGLGQNQSPEPQWYLAYKQKICENKSKAWGGKEGTAAEHRPARSEGTKSWARKPDSSTHCCVTLGKLSGSQFPHLQNDPR